MHRDTAILHAGYRGPHDPGAFQFRARSSRPRSPPRANPRHMHSPTDGSTIRRGRRGKTPSRCSKAVNRLRSHPAWLRWRPFSASH